ncbi:hypothetical protein B0H16DRAFT_1505957 [Mycena metata]|uniref:F-box domain-containing protein n=1 Tax=Mycena metata TaxID=1033252 RepID=A0AAD7K1E4_9AGAR|nr:hypothetical protein B0H16DRAFT_1505957 [Mycena metata]
MNQTTVSKSPATLIPHDILHDLFVLCTKNAIQSGEYYFPVVLSHVCSSWRATALATPTIWSALYTSSGSNSDHTSARSRAYLERSQTMPVTAMVRVPLSTSATEADPEFALLASNANRITTLGLVCAHMAQLPALFGCFPVAMPVLDTLYIAVRTGTPKEMEFSLRLALDASERIPFRMPPVVNGVVRWSSWATQNITHLCMNGLTAAARPSMEAVQHILEGCKSTLETFEFKGWAPQWDDPNAVLEPVVLPMLTQLDLLWLDDLSPLAGLIIAPTLASLNLQNGVLMATPYALEDGAEPHGCDMPRLLAHLGRSCATLAHLYLYGVQDCPRSVVDAFFAGMPALDMLILCAVGDTFQDALLQPESRFRVPREAIFPQLEHLSVTDVPATDLARFVLRHKTLCVLALRTLYLTADQEFAAYEPERTILGMVLDVCVGENDLQLICMQAPEHCRSELASQE